MKCISYGYDWADYHSINVASITLNGEEMVVRGIHALPVNITDFWSATQDVELILIAELDEPLLRKSAKLRPNDEIWGTFVSYSAGTKLQHHSERVLLKPGTNRLDLHVPAFAWSGEAVLNFSISINFSETAKREIGAPMLPFSTIYNFQARLILAGENSRINTQIVDFSEDESKSDCLWNVVLNLDSDFDTWATMELSTVVRVELNSKYYEVLAASDVALIALATDMVMDSLAVFMESDEKVNLLRARVEGTGGWVNFAGFFYDELFGTQVRSRQNWLEDPAPYRAKIQSMIARSSAGHMESFGLSKFKVHD